jgi:hypothetical protein
LTTISFWHSSNCGAEQFPPDAAEKQQVRVDLACRDTQGIETVADKRQVIQPLDGFSVGPGSLSETGSEEVVSHASIGRRKKWERVQQRSVAWDASAACGDREGLVELPPDVAGDDDRSGTRGRPDGEPVSRPLVENVAAQNEHGAIDGDVVALMNLAGHAQVIGEIRVGILSVEISELSIDVELQQERQASVCRSFPNDDSISIAIVVRLWAATDDDCAEGLTAAAPATALRIKK